MVKAGLTLAKTIGADLVAESSEDRGEIRLTTGSVCSSMLDGLSGRAELVVLTRMADHIEVIPKGDTLEWRSSLRSYHTFSL